MDDFDPALLRDVVPLFPLPNCVLLPGAVLPLRVFEPRYVTLMHDLLGKRADRRLLGIALLTGENENLYHTNHASIHRVVGVGEVIQHAAAADGCHHILVHGRARARIAMEDKTGVYRKAKLKPLPTEPADMLDEVAPSVDDVRALFDQLVESGACERDLVKTIASRAASAAKMVDLGAAHLLGADSVAVKQRILEEERLDVRAEILAIHLRAMLEASQNKTNPNRPYPTWPPPPHPN